MNANTGEKTVGTQRSISSFIAVVALLACAASALADPPRPRVLFVVDTTGTMNSSLVNGAALGGDGSESYPGAAAGCFRSSRRCVTRSSHRPLGPV